MQLKPIKYHSPMVVEKKVDEIMKSGGKFITEAQLADILGLNVNKAVIKAAELKFSRIHVKNTRYYSKKQIRAYLSK